MGAAIVMSAWGDAWGDSWGDAWGVVAGGSSDDALPIFLTPEAEKPRKKKKKKKRRLSNAETVAMLIAAGAFD